MDIHAGRQRRVPALAIALVILILCIVPGQFWITKQFPSISGLAQLNPSLVFLDIPIKMPVGIDLILVPALFILLYPVAILFYPLRPGILSWRQSLQRIQAAFTGLFILLCCLLSGGLIYYLLQDHLTTQVRNGINSMGFIADIHLSYRGQETIYLRGSLVLFICFVIGMVIFVRKMRKQPGSQLTREQRMTPYERMLQEKKLQKEKEKQMMQEAERKIHGYHPDKSRKPAVIEQVAVQRNPDPHHPAHLCFSEPVSRLRPEAAYFMPR
jgi:hypothetical protein